MFASDLSHSSCTDGEGGEAAKERGKKMEEANMLVVIREGEAEVAEDPDDGVLAEELQIQEVIFFQLLQSREVLETPQALLPPPPPLVEETSSSTLIVDSSTPIEDPIDPKGKQPAKLKLSYLTTERGECSEAIHETFYCPICMEAAPTKDGFIINPCNDIFCISCMIHYITTKIEENAVSIPCPKPGCGSASLDPATCQNILAKDIFDRWSGALCELSLGLSKFYCPFKDCSALLINEGGEKITNCECPHCHKMFCARCKVPWHREMSCEEFERLGKDERGSEDLMLINLAKDKRWQRCPQCRMYVEKIDGCMFLKCRCGYCFCYACAAPMSNHYCEKCKR